MGFENRTRRGENAPNARFTREEVYGYRQRYAAGGVTIRALAREAGVSYATMQRLLSREHYADPFDS